MSRPAIKVSNPFFKGEAGDSGLLLKDSLLRDATIASRIGLFIVEAGRLQVKWTHVRERRNEFVRRPLLYIFQYMRRIIPIVF